MHFRPPVDRRFLLGLGIPVHRRQRRDAETRDGGAGEQRRLDVHQDALAARHQEAVGADDRGPLHQRIEQHRVAALFRLDVELGEIGEFLRPVGDRDVERDAARREPILAQLADGAEIGRAEEGDPVVLAPVERPLARFLDAQAGEPGALRQVARRRAHRHVEIALFVDDLARLIALDHVNVDRLLKEQSEVKKGDREILGPVGEQRVIGPENDLAPFLVVDLLEHVGSWPGRSEIGAMRLLAGVGLELLVGERTRAYRASARRRLPRRSFRRPNRSRSRWRRPP